MQIIIYRIKASKVLLYSTGSYIQCCGITMKENNIKKNVYICTTESLCCTAEISTHCKSTIFQ